MTGSSNQESSEIQETLIFKISEEDQHFKRFDQYLTEKMEGHSRTFIKNLYQKGLISLSEESPQKPKKIELKKMPPTGTWVEVHIPPPIPSNATPEDIPLEFLFEDEHLLFVNKPAGLVTHPAPGNYTGTLVNGILFHCKDLQGVGDQRRPGIVHRLDKGTSGVMVVAKNTKCHEGLIQLFSEHNIDRIYECLCVGKDFPPQGNLKSSIGRSRQNRLKMAVNVSGGKNAVTHCHLIHQYHNLAHIECKLETGRTHQIRVHLSSLLKRPILRDPLYGNPPQDVSRLGAEFEFLKDYPHPLLHARSLGLIHPITKEKLFFEVPPPPIFTQTLETAKRVL